jgi:predicted PurR-regulated permease PerM
MNDINAVTNRTIFRFLTVTAGFIGAVLVAYMIRRELAWFGIAFFLAIALNPAVERFSKYMPRKSRGLATGLLFLLIAAFIVIMAVTMIPPLISQTQSLLGSLPSITNSIANGHNPISSFLRQYNLIPQLQTNQERIASAVSAVGGSALDFIKVILTSLITTVTILVLTFFMLVEGPKWIELVRRAGSQTRLEHREELVGQMYEAVSGYVNGNLFTSLVAAIATAIILSIIGVPYSIPLGIVVGVFDLLPLIGATLGAVVVVIVSLFHSVPSAIIMTIFYLVYQQLENHILQPLVYSKTVYISPLTVLMAALVGAALGGLVGALVAIPIAASALILVKDYLAHQQSR